VAPSLGLVPVMTSHSDDVELAELDRYVTAHLGGAATALATSTGSQAVQQAILRTPKANDRPGIVGTDRYTQDSDRRQLFPQGGVRRRSS
jgi:hypothetical protein